MADQLAPNQANNIREVMRRRGVVPFDQLKWEDFPLENRLRGLRALLDALARLKEKERSEIAGDAVELKAA